MPSDTINITAGAITWDKSETEVSQDEVAYVNIRCVGYTATEGQDIATALTLVPKLIPVSDSGPVGNAFMLSASELHRRAASFDGDGTIRLAVDYKCQVAAISTNPDGDENAAEDKTSKRITTIEEPLLSHPVARKFPRTELNMLSGLLNGYIRTAWDLSQEAGETTGPEFVRQNPSTGRWDQAVTFSATAYTVSLSGKNITASPVDFARIIKAGITTYRAATQTFCWSGVRKTEVKPKELNQVGTIINPERAPEVNDREWFFDGLMEDQVTDSTYRFDREYLLSGPGGALKQLYAGGTGDINGNPS